MKQFMTDADIENLTKHHPPSGEEIILAHEELRRIFKDAMLRLNDILPECPEKTIALRATHKALQAANTCVAVKQQTYGMQLHQHLQQQEKEKENK